MDKQASATTDEHRLNLREMQAEGLESLYGATTVGGFGLILAALQFAGLRQAGLLGILLMLAPLPLRLLIPRRYLADAWLLVGLWLAGAQALTLLLPASPAACLMALPTGLAAIFIGPLAGLATGAAASLLALAGGMAPERSVFVLSVIWGVLALVWLASRPLTLALQWSWDSYTRAYRQLDEARDTQAELKQAVKDLAESSLQAARLNELLGAARRAAEEAERAKAEFVANVSHELRTPLNMIIGFAETIVEAPATYGARLPPTLLADVAAIQRNAQHLASLINDVLDISQVEAQRMTLVREWNALAEIVEAAVQAVQPLFEARGLDLRVDLPADLPRIHCDRTRIRQVLLNLLNNAARFTDEGGVTISARCDETQVIVTVADTGPGIAKEDLPRLFEPFRQLDGSLRRRQGGSGLGLNISRRFVELHGGEMGVESELGVGARFWFSLPLAPPAAEATFMRWLRSEWEPRRHSRLTPKPQLVPRIVVLEPEDVLQSAVGRYLDGVEVTAAATPDEAQALLAAAPAQVLLVRADSPELTQAWVAEMHDAPYATPVVACTLPMQAEGSTLGVAGYLTKPVTRAQLFRAIEGLGRPVRSILLTDDDPEALQLFARILTSGERRYRVLQAGGGREALELLRGRRPDLLLLDLVMPDLDGTGVLAEKNRDPALRDIPVLILSAQDPAGQPIVAPSLLATRSGGLSLADLLRAGLAVSETLAVPRRAPGPAPAGAPGA